MKGTRQGDGGETTKQMTRAEQTAACLLGFVHQRENEIRSKMSKSSGVYKAPPEEGFCFCAYVQHLPATGSSKDC